MQQPRRLAVAEKKCIVEADFLFDLCIIRHDFAAYFRISDDLFRSFALCRAVICAVFGNQPGRRSGNFGAQHVRV